MLKTISVKTSARSEMVDITGQVQRELAETAVREGTLTLYVPHTTAAVTINEGADPAVKDDILMLLERVVPWKAEYKHMEGNAAAHIKASLVGPSVTVLLSGGRLMLGTWQKIFFCEFDGPRNRRLHLQIAVVDT
ncbi:MAG: secondary thiamine-phosphate synthase enzyme YjbQ [Syntrophobacteria bacterium]